MTYHETLAANELADTVQQLIEYLKEYPNDNGYTLPLPDNHKIGINTHGVFLLDDSDQVIATIRSRARLLGLIPLWHENYKTLQAINRYYLFRIFDDIDYAIANRIVHHNVTWLDRLLGLV